MTPQEKDMIQGLIDRVQQTRLSEKDSNAENLIQQSLGRNPDSLYILAQTVLVQKYALDQAQKQLTELKSQIGQANQQQQQPRHATSFLGSLLGLGDAPSPPPPLPPSSGQGSTSAGPQYAPVQGYAPQAGYAQGSPQFGAPSAGGGGFLRSAMQTATGVAAGALAFQGIESLMHGFGGGSGGFGGQQGFGGFGGGGAPREEVVNNYYGDSGDSGQDRSGGGLSSDIEDRRNDGSDQFASGDSNPDTGSDTSSMDDTSGSDSIFDSGDSGGDSSFDSGSGDDSSFS